MNGQGENNMNIQEQQALAQELSSKLWKMANELRGTMEDKQIISKNPFGLNITLPKKTLQEVQKVAQQEIGNISVNPFLEYFKENDKVFSGQVAKEIRKYQSQIYTLGQVMREGKSSSSFNINM